MTAMPELRKPTYAISSVDNAIRLLQMLRDLGEVRGKEAAAELGISPSTAHRLMSMLVYRGFAIQNESRVYLPGPAIGVPPSVADTEGARRLKLIVRPRLDALRDRAQESAYFMVLTSRVVRFLLTAESAHRSSTGDRHGFVIPAHTSAGGRAILSAMHPDDLRRIYGDPDDLSEEPFSPEMLDELVDGLRATRSRGYEVGIGAIERGIVTIAAPIRHAWVRPRAAISLSGPIRRQRSITDAATVERLLSARDDIERELLARERPVP